MNVPTLQDETDLSLLGRGLPKYFPTFIKELMNLIFWENFQSSMSLISWEHLQSSWVGRANTEDQINRKPEDGKM